MGRAGVRAGTADHSQSMLPTSRNPRGGNSGLLAPMGQFNLEAVVDAATKQQELLVRNLETAKSQQQILTTTLETSKSQLLLLQKQWKREEERQAQKPYAVFSIPTTSGPKALTELEKLTEIDFHLEKDEKWGRLTFVVTNTGNVEISNPLIRVVAIDTNVKVDRANQRGGERPEPNAFQFSGPGVPDIQPEHIAGGGYSYRVDITLPDTIISFDLSLSINGKNLPRISHMLHFKAIRSSN